MKIGILTYHRAHNYGAVLQAYALKTHLQSRGFQAEFIDYWPDYRKGIYGVYNFKFLFKRDIKLKSKIKSLVLKLLGLPLNLIRHGKFDRFIKKYILTGDYHHPIREGRYIPDNYAVYLYGSDQIWRYNTDFGNGFDEVYFGTYPKNRRDKITYAASMGVINYTAIDAASLNQYLRNFDIISVREQNLKELLKSHFKIDAFQVLDPVFLLDLEDWEVISPQKEVGQKYLLFYELNISEEAETLARRIAKQYRLKIVRINGGVGTYDFLKNLNNKSGPVEFINLFRNASYVVSSSFHGVAFSLIFEKDFFALGFKENYQRVLSLLKSVNLEDRFVQGKSGFKIDKIDFSKSKLLLQEQIEHSKNFLSKIDNLLIKN